MPPPPSPSPSSYGTVVYYETLMNTPVPLQHAMDMLNRNVLHSSGIYETLMNTHVLLQHAIHMLNRNVLHSSGIL